MNRGSAGKASETFIEGRLVFDQQDIVDEAILGEDVRNANGLTVGLMKMFKV